AHASGLGAAAGTGGAAGPHRGVVSRGGRPRHAMSPMMVIALSVLAAAALLTQVMRAIATGTGTLDIPNERSSHAVPTPRGGGVAIVVVMTGAALLLAWRHVVPVAPVYALAVGGLAVALVGFADDHRALPAVTRLTVHFAAALWALLCLGGLPPLQIGGQLVVSSWAGYVFGALGIVWAIN